jgi:hypothetical protein
VNQGFGKKLNRLDGFSGALLLIHATRNLIKRPSVVIDTGPFNFANQIYDTLVPHSLQNLAPLGIWAPHFAHAIVWEAVVI